MYEETMKALNCAHENEIKIHVKYHKQHSAAQKSTLLSHSVFEVLELLRQSQTINLAAVKLFTRTADVLKLLSA